MIKLSKRLILCLLIATPAHASGPPAASPKAVVSQASKAKAKAPAKANNNPATKERSITAADTKAVAKLNNDSVRALNRGDYKTAADLLLQALKINPKYQYARSNLAICYNNLALKSPAATAMGLFHKALVLDPENKITKANLEALITASQRNPANFDDRVFLANQALKEKDYVSAICEFKAALAIKDDEDIRKQLSSVPRTDAILTLSSTQSAPSSETDIDFNPYMLALQRKMKSNWHPPKAVESKRTEVMFQVHQDGSVSHVRLSRPSGVPATDQAALTTVVTAAPFDRLPKGAPPYVDIQFTFDYNVHGGAMLGNEPSSSVAAASKKVSIATLAIQKKQYDAAMKVLEEARALDEYNYDAPKLLASVLCHQASKETSADKQSELAYRALDLDMNNAEAQKLLSNTLTKKNKNPQLASDRVALAQAWLDQRNYKNARVEIQAALRLDSKNEDANKMLPLILKEEAIGQIVQRWQHALQSRNNAENRAGLGYAYEMANHLPEAKAEYKKALELDPYCIVAKQRVEALKQSANGSTTESAKAGAPQQSPLATLLKEAASLHSAKDFDRSIGEYFKAVKLDPKSEEAWYGLATALQDKSDYTRAIRLRQSSSIKAKQCRSEQEPAAVPGVAYAG